MFLLLALLLMLLAGTAVRAETNPPPEGDPKPQDGDGNAPAKTYDEAYVKALRDEAAKHRTEKQALAAKLAEHDKEKLTETEKLKQEAEDAKSALTARERELLTLRAEKAAKKAAPDAIDTDWLVSKLDLPKLTSDTGEIDAGKLATAITALRKEHPKLFSGSALGEAAGAGSGSGGRGSDMNARIRGHTT